MIKIKTDFFREEKLRSISYSIEWTCDKSMEIEIILCETETRQANNS
jgi:hypothetical protein